MSCGVGHRGGSDLAVLWLWHRPAAVPPIPPLAWELPYAADAVLEKKRQKKKSYLTRDLYPEYILKKRKKGKKPSYISIKRQKRKPN